MKETNQSKSEFDVFLCHNSNDKPFVKDIGNKLKDKGILPWLDEWELQPGLPWQRILEEQIEKIRSAAVFVGKNNFGPWQDMEIEAFLREFVKRKCPVIPVILPNCRSLPELPVFLRGMTWVDFRQDDPDPLEWLIWGITSKRSANSDLKKTISFKTRKENSRWPFSSNSSDKSTRYFIEIQNKHGQYQGRIHQGVEKKNYPLNNLKLSPNDTVSIKNKNIQLSDLIQALTQFNQQWLREWFDERGQYEVGIYLFRQIFGELKPDDIQLKDGKVVLHIITDDEHIAGLPWMLLAHHGVFLCTTGWSMVLSKDIPDNDCQLPRSPKMLIIAPQPDGVSDTKADIHLDKLEELLSSAYNRYASGEDWQIVRTWDLFKEKLRTFQPNIIYYYGYRDGDSHTSRLVFESKSGKCIYIPIAELVPMLQATSEEPPLIAYINCCLGDIGGILGARAQLGNFIPVVITSRTMASIDVAQAQGMSFWKNVLLKGIPPHEAVSYFYSELGELDLNVSDTRWITPVIHCRYRHWIANPPKPLSRMYRDPYWHFKLDRKDQFSKVFYKTFEMLMERSPRALSYLWYGEKNQGLDHFHRRLKVELQEKLSNAIVYEVKPDWPTDLFDPAQSFSDMLAQAFEIDHLDQLAAHIRMRSRSIFGKQTLVYVCHRPVTSSLIFHPKYIRAYLEWWNLNFVPRLPEKAYALLGISYEVKDALKFYNLLVKKEKLDDLVLSHTVFELLDELEKIKRKDLLDFIQTHKIPLPPDLRDSIFEDILKKTGGIYEKVLDELKELESRAWRQRVVEEARKEQEKQQSSDEYEDVF